MAPPERLGPYEHLREVGHGGMAVVYRGTSVTCGGLAAVKTPLAHKERLFAGLRTEVQALKRLDHPGIVRILDDGQSGPRPWYAMEYLHGKTFEQYIKQIWSDVPRPAVGQGEDLSTTDTDRTEQTPEGAAGGPPTLLPPRPPSARPPPSGLPPAAAGHLREVLQIALNVCDPLAYLHSRGIVHRDISARNLWLRPDGTAVIMDFGIASLMSYVPGREKVDATRIPLGALAYVSPEQIREKQTDPRSDLYSFGCVLYEMITGNPPFPSTEKAQILAAHLRTTPARPSLLVAGVPDALDRLLLEMLEKDARDRTGHADEVEAALREILEMPPREGRAPRRVSLYRPGLAGRDAELARVFDQLEGSAGRRGFAGLVSGTSGSGKTRFVSAVAQHALGRGFRVVSGECLGAAASGAGTNAGPLHPFRPLLTAIADHCLVNGEEATDRILGRHIKILEKHEPLFASLPGRAELPEPPVLPPHAAERRLIDALRETLCAFADRVKLLLVIDDLQWADPLSLKVLLGLSEEVFRRHSLVLLAAYRSEEEGPVLRQMKRRPWVFVEHVGPLDGASVLRVASDMLGAKSVPEPHVEAIADRSRGNPFFVGECLRMLVAEGRLCREAGRWAWTLDGAPLDALLPLRIEDLLRRRIGAGAEDAAELLRVASVLGREVELPLVAGLAGMSLDGVRRHVDELVEAQLLERAGADRARFVHDKIREVAYSGLAEERRRALHGAAAAALARATGEDRRPATAQGVIAHHLRAAGDLEGAREALERAASEALAAFAAADAIESLQGALEIDDELGGSVDPRVRARWLQQMGRAYVDIGRSEQGMRWVLDGLSLLGWPVERSAARLLGSTVAQAARLAGRLVRGPLTAMSGPARADFLEAGSAAELLVPIFTYTTGRRLELFYAVISHLYIAETLGTPRERAWAYINAHVIFGLLPLAPFSGACRRRAHEALGDVSDPAVKSWIHLLTCVGATGKAEWERAIAHGKACSDLAEEIGFDRRWEEAQGMLCTARLLCGDFERAIETSRQRASMAALRGDAQTQLWSALGLAQAELNLGRTASVLSQAPWIEQRLRELTGRNERIFGYGVLAEARLRSGDAKGALDAARKGAAAVHEGWPPVVYCVNAYSLLANVLLELAEDPSGVPERERRGLVGQAIRMCLEVSFSAVIYPVHRARSLIFWGRAAALLRFPEAACRGFGEAIVMARKYDLPFDEGLAHLAIARAAPGSVEERRDHLRIARDLLLRVRALHEVARVDAEVAKL